mmetsp:Transcript_41924/g.104860  ORF Transcript_41924/g.104860 Transcript_41924/m.104860 type:complete len:147 (+) Transcript_41924:3-443(+)
MLNGQLGRLVVLVFALLATLSEANTNAGGQQLQQLEQHKYTEDGEWVELEGAPLVTQASIQMAKRLNPGVPVQALGGPQPPQGIHPRMVQQGPRVTSLAPEGGNVSAFADVPPYVFVLTFVGSIACISILFYFAERMWAKRQESGQ